MYEETVTTAVNPLGAHSVSMSVLRLFAAFRAAGAVTVLVTGCAGGSAGAGRWFARGPAARLSTSAAAPAISAGQLRGYLTAVEAVRLPVNRLLDEADPILDAYHGHRITPAPYGDSTVIPPAMISAHSGGAERARPGSLAAYRAVVSAGAEYAEFDVRRASDGTLVAQHSADGPTGPTGPDGEPVLAAREVMEVLAAGGVRGHVDLKGTGFERQAVELARSSFGPDGFVVTTADPVSVAAIGAEFAAVPVGLSVGFGPASITRDLRRLRWPLSFPLAAVRASGASWVAMNYRYARPEVLDRCVAAGLRIMVWTVNDDRRLARYLGDPRVAVVVTDRPEHAVALRARQAGRP